VGLRPGLDAEYQKSFRISQNKKNTLINIHLMDFPVALRCKAGP
jgi:hypothetical protein